MNVSYDIGRGNIKALLLHSLTTEPKTALQIIEFLQSEIGIRFSPGSIYSKLWKLIKEGYISQTEKKFELTQNGRERLKDDFHSLRAILLLVGDSEISETIWVVFKDSSFYAICRNETIAQKARTKLAAILGEVETHFEIKEIARDAVHPWGILCMDNSVDIK